METTTVTAILSILLSAAAEHTGSTLSKSILDTWKSLSKKLDDGSAQDEGSHLALQEVSERNVEELSPKTIEVISEVVQEKASRNPEFAAEIQEDLKSLVSKIREENPILAQKLEEETKKLAIEMKNIGQKIEDLGQQIKDIQINVSSGDYVGKDPYILSGNPRLINTNHYYIHNGYEQVANIDIGSNIGTINSTSNEADAFASNQNNNSVNSSNVIINFVEPDRLLSQIESIKGKVTQYFTAKTGMDTLNKIRQPRALGDLYIQEANLNLPLLFGNVTFKMRRKEEKTKERNVEVEMLRKDETTDYYLSQIREIEYNLGNDPLEDSKLLRDLGNIAGTLNNKISILNNSFIFALYPASSSKELVENMASKIGYREYREEAEMHLTVIVRLVEKLNHLMKKFDLENLNSVSNAKKIESKKEDLNHFVDLLIDLDQDIESEALPEILKLLRSKNPRRKSLLENEEKKEDLFGNRLYILSDESQAAVGIMIDIENRRLLVERLIEKDRVRQNKTASLVTFSIILVILLICVGGIFYGPQFTVGDKPLKNLNLPLLNVPWPVVFWSFIGSFAAMIYRFNRQPIYEFGDVIKWTLTRLVQGVVLGSAFYLILVSGLALLTGHSLETTTPNTSNKLADEVILVLTFLVGFSDKFADTMFNALIDRYSNTKKDSEDK